jgi:large subunit ribosomal protein LP0
MSASRSYSVKKQGYFAKMNMYLDKYDKIMFIGCDNVTSRQFNKMRIEMRPGNDALPFTGNILMGKNTMMVKVLKQRTDEDPDDQLKKEQYQTIKELLKLNVGMIFLDGDLQDVKKMVKDNVVQAPAKVGQTAPCDVVIPQGNTGLEPGQTSFFQALNIHTKITKGTIEILNDTRVVVENERVGHSAATLLKKMKMNPFFWGLKIVHVFDQGSFYPPQVLNMTDYEKEQKLGHGISTVIALCLSLGWTTEASFPHVMMNGFKNCLAISLLTDYDFDAFDGKQLKADILSGKISAKAASAAAPAAGGGGDAPKAAAPPPQEESEEEEADFGLFD